MDDQVTMILLVFLLTACVFKLIIVCVVYRAEIRKVLMEMRGRRNKRLKSKMRRNVSPGAEVNSPHAGRMVQYSDPDLQEFERLEQLVLREEFVQPVKPADPQETKKLYHKRTAMFTRTRIRNFYEEVDDILHEIGETKQSLTLEENTQSADNNGNRSCNLDKRRRDLETAVRICDVELLESAIEWAIFDGCEVDLGEEIFAARNLLKQQINLDRLRAAGSEIRQSVVSELRSYANPPKPVHDVMMCVYLLLGFDDEHQLKKWPAIQALMSQSGKHNLKRLIERRRGCDLSDDVIARVKAILACYDFQHIYDVSEGAAVFYVWIMDITQNYKIIESL